ncbi:threonine synthase, partial [Candidatus Sumerlaeota bacterium]|nr:threonine synthase [Candidatus Sumerlaeota bacterium]
MDQHSHKPSRVAWLLKRHASGEERTTVGLVSGMACVRCKRTFGVLKSAQWCPDCGMDGALDVQYDYESVGKVLTPARLEHSTLRNQWRYLPLLPLRGLKRVPPLEIGWTPLYKARALAQTLGINQLLLKDETRNPTGSIEDRATALATSRALEDGHSTVTCGPASNAALSAAALSASAGLSVAVFVSRDNQDELVAQLLLTGANVFVVEGSESEAEQLSVRCATEYGWYNCNKALNPFLVEGMKTVAFEMGEQMQWAVPDCIIVPVGHGSTIAALWKGYCEMKKLGWIAQAPKMIGVQPEGASAIYAAWKEGREATASTTETVAQSLAVAMPRDWRKAVGAVRESGGAMVSVSDRQILKAMHLLAERMGLIADPGSATALAGLASLLSSRQLSRT